MLPADFCNCTYDVRAENPSSRFLAGTMAMTTFLFLRITHDPRELLSQTSEAVTRGEPRMRPIDRDPGAGSSCLRRFSRPRYLDRRATLILLVPAACAAGFGPQLSPQVPRLAPWEMSLVTIDVHGSLDRAKDVSSSVRALFRRSHEECVRLAHADDVPLLILPEGTCCRRCDRLHGNEPRTGEPDRPRPAFLRQPAKAIGIPRIRVPSTVATAGT